MACASASARGTPFVSIGARVTLPSTVLCGNRLNSWKTMPTLLRMCRRWRSSAGTSWPFRRMCQSSSPSIRM